MAIVVAATVLGPVPQARAGDYLHALKFGILAHDVPDLWSGFAVEDRWVDLNFEAQFKPSLLLFGGTLRPVLGASINTNGDTSHAYLDARWEIDCASNIFFGLGLGAAIHDGETGGLGSDPDKKWLGSRVLFHIPAEIGIHLDAHNDLSANISQHLRPTPMTYNEGRHRHQVRS